MKLEPFAPGHLDTFIPGEEDLTAWDQLDLTEQRKNWEGKAVVAVENGVTHGIAGFGDAGNNVGSAWVFMSDEMRKRPFFFYRMIKRGLELVEQTQGLKMIEAWVKPGFKDGEKMALRLGFRKTDDRMVKWY